MRRRLLAVLVLFAGATLGILAPGEARAQNRFWLVNDSGRVIERAFVSSSRVADWGPDILGNGVLPPGQRVWVTPNFGDCVIDIRVAYQGGGEDSRMGVNTCGLSQIVFGRGAGTGATVGGSAGATAGRPAGNPSFYLTNGTGQPLREVYVSLATDSNWGPDRLGTNVLQPGQRLQVSLPAVGVCQVDMRVVQMDGRAAERRRVDTCNISEYVWR